MVGLDFKSLFQPKLCCDSVILSDQKGLLLLIGLTCVNVMNLLKYNQYKKCFQMVHEHLENKGCGDPDKEGGNVVTTLMFFRSNCIRTVMSLKT